MKNCTKDTEKEKWQRALNEMKKFTSNILTSMGMVSLAVFFSFSPAVCKY
jgi:hypothetical protein